MVRSDLPRAKQIAHLKYGKAYQSRREEYMT